MPNMPSINSDNNLPIKSDQISQKHINLTPTPVSQDTTKNKENAQNIDCFESSTTDEISLSNIRKIIGTSSSQMLRANIKVGEQSYNVTIEERGGNDRDIKTRKNNDYMISFGGSHGSVNIHNGTFMGSTIRSKELYAIMKNNASNIGKLLDHAEGKTSGQNLSAQKDN